MWRFEPEIVGAEILIEPAVAQHVKDRGQDRAGNGTEGFFGSGSGYWATQRRIDFHPSP